MLPFQTIEFIKMRNQEICVCKAFKVGLYFCVGGCILGSGTGTTRRFRMGHDEFPCDGGASFLLKGEIIEFQRCKSRQGYDPKER